MTWQALFLKANDPAPLHGDVMPVLPTLRQIAGSNMGPGLTREQYIAAVVGEAEQRLMEPAQAPQVLDAARKCAEWWWENVVTLHYPEN